MTSAPSDWSSTVKSGRSPSGRPVETEQPVGDRVERATPHALGLALAGRAFGPREHLAGGSPAERQEQDPLGPHAALDQVADPAGERGRLAGPGARHDQQRTLAEEHGGALLRIEVVEHVFEAYNPRAPVRGRGAFSRPR